MKDNWTASWPPIILPARSDHLCARTGSYYTAHANKKGLPMRLMIAALVLLAWSGTARADEACAQFLPNMQEHAAKVHALLDSTLAALPSSAVEDIRAGKADAAKADARDELGDMFGSGSDEIIAWAEATIDSLLVLEAAAAANDAAIAKLEACGT